MGVVLPVRIGDPWLSIDAGAVIEILGARPWFAIPSGSREMPGVLVWRGRAVPVVDLAAVLATGRPRPLDPARPRTVIVTVGGSTIAIPVDEVREAQGEDAGGLAARLVDLRDLVRALATAALPEDCRESLRSLRRPTC
jgi:chemotaxis signal transduction protein